MKTLCAAAILATAFMFSSPIAGVDQANASDRRDRIQVCDWYRTKAQFASLRGNLDKSEFYWHLFRACMNDRID
ncbi:MAG: hypothetical protein HKN05_07155 [Rhizobiales bacterium]|nr:hypothetical protein [Hyphomicrobiales bacterium]